MTQQPTITYRTESDSMGDKQIPSTVYYGIQTLRAVENFPISGIKPLSTYVDACVLIKKAAAIANGKLGCIPEDISTALIKAADEVLAGNLRDQFVVDVYQAGAGTSHHMNVNEVLSNRALEIMGDEKGNYKRVSPNDHVNYGQSTNDVIPTAIRIGGLLALEKTLFPALSQAIASLDKKAVEFHNIVKSGRTHLQDAVPVRLGETFRAWAQILREHSARIATASGDLTSLGLGGSAAGTGLNTHPEYCEKVAQILSELIQKPLKPAPHLMAAMQSMAPFVNVSGAIRNLAQDCVKMSHDLRLMDSGPKTGFKEIQLPPVQPGSSIMPGKYNPVMAEMTSMVCFQVMGYDSAIALCAQAGQLELNVMMPLIAYNLIHSIEILGNTISALTTKCLDKIEANGDRCLAYAEGSLALVTALNTHIGYLNAAAVAKESLETGKSLRQIVLERGLMNAEDLATVLDLEKMSAMPENRAVETASIKTKPF
ncbi:MAG: aspartate ammonia-lyase [Microcoleus sp. PH2017_29_MFU_D_A]|uniref:aspartate ammonia-lyase n=1 Tax=unclassified Microcoleus TaxID=2642155 RepID=UPI001D5FC5A3|nr:MULTISPECIES: aspartate ammonia-lyase [unclassified Microcoleus]MCC3502806.1 aspartate ammonia-lyase [Microcoleus sp. PH2017_19_SFW_U_A]MCC3509841.1 aspartate ammonia-lyase [Microcoleus sp. PH2017_17_BER_D_A]TAG58027.1 MAG: aspartate ammonia-lyase [Oscillatoriales cyanobacterium]MCC3474844.1 aspartate ammonia-lyase [Microcoleus sp. PH2017_13_LAR_U_A]MCC3487344.1 aspartate ammonia-lyase [Microcoleus sp. PH2017_14_LAR_D_A]